MLPLIPFIQLIVADLKSERNVCRAKDLIRKLLHVNPNVRLTASQALKHEWIEAKMEKEDMADLSLTREKLRKKDEHTHFKVPLKEMFCIATCACM